MHTPISGWQLISYEDNYMKINIAILGILVTMGITFGGWMLNISSNQKVDRTMILANSDSNKQIHATQEKFGDIMHKLDKTLTKFEGQFVTKDEIRLLEKELLKRITDLEKRL